MPTSSAAARTASPEPAAIAVRYAAGDDDVIAIHQFLLRYAQPALRCPVNHAKSAQEVWRVCHENAGLMAFCGGEMVGTLGLMQAVWWYGDGAFLTDRWHFVKPEHHHGPANAALIAEARGIAAAAGLEFIHQGKIRGEKQGITRMRPALYRPESG